MLCGTLTYFKYYAITTTIWEALEKPGVSQKTACQFHNV